MSETRVMIIAGEASGDLHGAHLIHALKELVPDLSVCGIGGEHLQKEGVDILFDAGKLAVVGLAEVLGHISDIRAAKKILETRLKENPPHLLILIDFPDFNLMLAGKAKRLGVPVFYYISPQVWAWRSGRVKKIRRLVDRMAVILPFEKDFYKEYGMEVEFVGHPLMDSVQTRLAKDTFLEKYGINKDATTVGILPGSRRKEVTKILPIFLEVAQRLAEEDRNLVFLLPLASTLSMEDLSQIGLVESSLNIKVITEDRYDLMAACEAVMAASGTVTLELAILNVPMVVSYKVSPLTHFIGSRLIKVRYASLVNLVAGREVVPEFLQHDATTEKIYEAMHNILTNSEDRAAMLKEIAEVCARFGSAGASQRAARIALETMNR